MTIALPSVELLDPHFTTDQPDRLSLRANLFEPLIGRDAQLRLTPELAAGWEVSADAQTWTIHLRPGATFTDGRPLDASTVVATVHRFGGAGGAFGMGGVYAGYLAGAETLALDPATVQIRLRGPLADFGDVLAAMPSVVPVLGDLERFLGTSPYVVAKQGPAVLTLAPRGAGGPGPLHWCAWPDPAARLAAVRAGVVDLATSLPAAEDYLADPLHLASPGTLAVVFFMNLFRGPCTDVRVRRAINLAVDREAIVRDVLGGAADLLTGPMSRFAFGVDPEVAPYPHDPAAARRLLAEAGVGAETVLTIRAPTSTPMEGPALAAAVAGDLSRVGLRSVIQLEPDRPAYARQIRYKQIGDLACFDSSPLSTYRVLREKLSARYEGWWWQGYDSPAFADGLAVAERTADPEVRADIYRRLHRIVHEDAPWLFLYAPRHVYAVGPRLLGRWQPRPDGIVDLRALAYRLAS